MVPGLVLVVVIASFGGLVALLVMFSRGSSTTAPRPRFPETDPPRLAESLPPVPPARQKATDAAARPIVVPLPPPPRPVRRCGHCRAQGHTRTVCPQLTGALTLPRL